MGTKKQLHCIVLDVNKNEVRVSDIDRTLEAYYKEIDTDMIEIPRLKIGGRRFDIIADEEGVLKAEPIVSAFSTIGEGRLVGNLIICGPNLKNLTDADVAFVNQHIRNTTKGWRLVDVEY